jgi:hypothetical protein
MMCVHYQEKIQAENQGGSVVKEQLRKLKEVADEPGITKQGEAIKERLSQTMSQTAETVVKGSEQLAQTEVYKKMAKVGNIFWGETTYMLCSLHFMRPVQDNLTNHPLINIVL